MKVPNVRITSLRTKMIVTLVPLTVLILGAMTAIAVTRMTHAQKHSAFDEMRQRVSREAADYDAGQERALSLSRTLAGALVPRNGLTRADVGDQLESILEQTPETAGVWVAFEPERSTGSTPATPATSATPRTAASRSTGTAWRAGPRSSR